jgi:hypothetical protein
MSTIGSLVAVLEATKDERDGYQRIMARDAVVGDECWTRNLRWEKIKNSHMLTGVEVQVPPCRRCMANAGGQIPPASGGNLDRMVRTSDSP